VQVGESTAGKANEPPCPIVGGESQAWLQPARTKVSSTVMWRLPIMLATVYSTVCAVHKGYN